MTIHPSFVDLDLSNVPDSQATGLVELPENEMTARMAAVPNFSEKFPTYMVPRSQWSDRIGKISKNLRGTVTRIYSQGQEGSCVGFGSAQMLETTLRRRYGIKHWVSLSGMSIYKRIGSSPSSGAMIPDGMDAVLEGALPVDSPENKAKYAHTHPRTGFRTPLPSGWQQTAALFRGTNWAKCSGADEIMSALLNEFCGIVGRDGHCVPYVLPEQYENGGFCAGYANSWDSDWGDEGFGYDSERTMNRLTCYVLLDVCVRPDLGIQPI